MSRCTGHCCKNFDLPMGPGQLALVREIAERGDIGTWRTTGGQVCWAPPILNDAGHGVAFTSPEEAAQIARMARFVGRDARGVHYYTCRHLDEQTGDCTIYATRPTLCRDYPYGKDCSREGCTLTQEDQSAAGGAA